MNLIYPRVNMSIWSKFVFLSSRRDSIIKLYILNLASMTNTPLAIGNNWQLSVRHLVYMPVVIACGRLPWLGFLQVHDQVKYAWLLIGIICQHLVHTDYIILNTHMLILCSRLDIDSKLQKVSDRRIIYRLKSLYYILNTFNPSHMHVKTRYDHF